MQKIPEDDRSCVAFLKTTYPMSHWIERSEAPVPWPAEEQEDENPQLCPSEEKETRPLSRSRRRLGLCRVQEKGSRHYICRFTRFVSALLVWVRRRHPARRNRRSDSCYVAIRFPPQRRSLSRPHTPCVRLERALEGLRKSPLTVDSHTAARLDVPVAT
ncbi:hypothetical protein Taro_051880 [Colocasia esculenta]|uniref:Uncharacterized protein n=1 Tax=Colocasia esculenta TaxID=4460 RepID=A0A843XI06_COLES|nr:hypothetical protein [Colocasia esculenta]